ncbi:DUF4333 domain-containing protein [Nocardia paucivorans]|uniref:DUF4333 domain-containing protein n=1 Tax=Nocardia paucivorans TaxID=114259 RepID=UPI0003066332
MSGPYGPNGAPNPGEGRNDPTQVWGGQQAPGGAGHNPGAPGPAHPGGADPTQQQWGGQQPFAQQPDPQQAQPTQKWGDQGGQQQWGQSQPQWGAQQPSQPQPQWGGQQPSQPHPQPQWQPQPQQQPQQQPQPQWGQQPQQDWGQQQSQEWQQPQQQWGQQPQQQWGGQPGPTPGGGKKTGLIVGLAVLALAVVGGVVALILVLTAKDELDQGALQNGVQKVLSESYGIEDISDVTCPSGQEVKVDATFTCELKVGGEAKTVNIKITKEDGTYEVGRPS